MKIFSVKVKCFHWKRKKSNVNDHSNMHKWYLMFWYLQYLIRIEHWKRTIAVDAVAWNVFNSIHPKTYISIASLLQKLGLLRSLNGIKIYSKSFSTDIVPSPMNAKIYWGACYLYQLILRCRLENVKWFSLSPRRLNGDRVKVREPEATSTSFLRRQKKMYVENGIKRKATVCVEKRGKNCRWSWERSVSVSDERVCVG